MPRKPAVKSVRRKPVRRALDMHSVSPAVQPVARKSAPGMPTLQPVSLMPVVQSVPRMPNLQSVPRMAAVQSASRIPAVQPPLTIPASGALLSHVPVVQPASSMVPITTSVSHTLAMRAPVLRPEPPLPSIQLWPRVSSASQQPPLLRILPGTSAPQGTAGQPVTLFGQPVTSLTGIQLVTSVGQPVTSPLQPVTSVMQPVTSVIQPVMSVGQPFLQALAERGLIRGNQAGPTAVPQASAVLSPMMSQVPGVASVPPMGIYNTGRDLVTSRYRTPPTDVFKFLWIGFCHC